MIVVDSSAIIAIAFEEAEAIEFFGLLTDTQECLCSPVTFAECAMVIIGKRAATPLANIDTLFSTLNVKQTSMGGDLGRLAAEAFVRFGKGRHPARLNLGDCFSYALAKSLNAPLLYKGNDFGHTDIVPAAATGARP